MTITNIFIFALPIISIVFTLWYLWILTRLKLSVYKKLLLLGIIISPFFQDISNLILSVSGSRLSLVSTRHYPWVLIVAVVLVIIYSIKSYLKRWYLTVALLPFAILTYFVMHKLIHAGSVTTELAYFYDSISNRYIISATQKNFGYTKISINRQIIDFFLFSLVRLEAREWNHMSYISVPLNGEEEIFTSHISRARADLVQNDSSAIKLDPRDPRLWRVFESDGQLIFNPEVLNGELKIPLLYNIAQNKVLLPYEVEDLPDFSHLTACKLTSIINFSLDISYIEP